MFGAPSGFFLAKLPCSHIFQLNWKLEDLRRLGRMMVAIATDRNNRQNYENKAQDVINKNDLI